MVYSISTLIISITGYPLVGGWGGESSVERRERGHPRFLRFERRHPVMSRLSYGLHTHNKHGSGKMKYDSLNPSPPSILKSLRKRSLEPGLRQYGAQKEGIQKSR